MSLSSRPSATRSSSNTSPHDGILLSGWVRWVQARGMSPGRLLQARSFGYPPPGADEASHNASGWTASCSPATGGVIAETRRGPASTPRGQFRFRCGVAACPMAAATATPVSARRPVRDREQLGRQRIQIDLITEPSGERLNGPGVARCYAGSWQAVSSLSAAIPCAASRRTAVPGSVTLLSRADVVPYEAATDLAKGCAWPDTEGVTGSNPVAPTTRKRRSGRVFAPGLPVRSHSRSPRAAIGQHLRIIGRPTVRYGTADAEGSERPPALVATGLSRQPRWETRTLAGLMTGGLVLARLAA